MKMARSVGAAIIVLVLCLALSSWAYADTEQWACGGTGDDFLVEGFVGSNLYAFSPFGMLLGDLYVIDLDKAIIALNLIPSQESYFGYLLIREDGQSVYWLSFDLKFQLQESQELFDRCSYESR